MSAKGNSFLKSLTSLQGYFLGYKLKNLKPNLVLEWATLSFTSKTSDPIGQAVAEVLALSLISYHNP